MILYNDSVWIDSFTQVANQTSLLNVIDFAALFKYNL